MARLRWGILGAARIAREWVAPAIHLSDRGELAAVASLIPGQAEDLAAPYGARVLHDYQAILADPGIDAIYIPLPNTEHVAWTARYLEAGKHVLCEPNVIETLRFPRLDQYRAQIDAFNATVLDGVAFPCPLEFSRGNQAAIDMIYAAAGRAR